MVTAVVYGVGAVNTVATRLMVEKGVTIVGALARSPEKVGRDLGRVVGLERDLGVTVSGEPETLLGRVRADIAVIAVNNYLSEHLVHVERCIRAGMNVVTTSEETLYPWRTSPELSATLDRLAREHGVTVVGTGHTDIFWVGLVSQLMGSAHRVRAVRGRSVTNADDDGPEISRLMHIGETQVEFREAIAAEAHTVKPPSFGRAAIDAIAAGLGLTPAAAVNEREALIAGTELWSGSLGRNVQAGDVIGLRDRDVLQTIEGIEISFDVIGKLYEPDDHGVEEWSIEGEPDLNLVVTDPDGGLTTASQLVNRIPDAINAPPGLVTVDRLPALRYRHFPLDSYVIRR